jgi:hypothetical protein
MQEHRRVRRPRRAPDELDMGAMQGIARLEGDHPFETAARDLRAQLGRRVAQVAERVVRRQLEPSSVPPT